MKLPGYKGSPMPTSSLEVSCNKQGRLVTPCRHCSSSRLAFQCGHNYASRTYNKFMNWLKESLFSANGNSNEKDCGSSSAGHHTDSPLKCS